MSMLQNDAYGGTFSYDADGNILNKVQNGTAATPAMDNLDYFYYDATNGTYNPATSIPANATNKLALVKDLVPAGNYNTDIDTQNPNNYTYNQIGNLISDATENITQIDWNLQNKITQIAKSAGPKPSLPIRCPGQPSHEACIQRHSFTEWPDILRKGMLRAMQWPLTHTRFRQPGNYAKAILERGSYLWQQPDRAIRARYGHYRSSRQCFRRSIPDRQPWLQAIRTHQPSGQRAGHHHRPQNTRHLQRSNNLSSGDH